MKFFKTLFAKIWAAWGLASFVITFLLIFVPSMFSYMMPQKTGQRYFILVSRLWMRCWLFLIGCNVKVYGRKHFAKGKNYVVVFNHNAFLDVPLSAPFVPGANKTIAKASFARVPLFGLFYKRGSVLVDRKNERSRVKSFENMKQVLATGMHMCLYPEGTRNRSAEPIKAFYDGAFKLAVAAQKDIIPCVIIGTKKAMPINKGFYLLPTPLKMYFLPPVSTTGIPVETLKKNIHDEMTKKYLEYTGNSIQA